MRLRLKRILDDKLIKHFRESHAPVQEIAIASVIGMFWALTPLVGAQMMLASFSWAILKSLKINSNLPIAVSLVWITNPLTMPFFYYAFYMLGYYTYMVFGVHIQPISFHLFEVTLEQAHGMDLLNGTMHWLRFMVNDLGLPMLIGSVIIGLPSAIASYPISIFMVNKYRTRQAEQSGLTLKEWEELHIHSRTRKEKESTAFKDELGLTDPDGNGSPNEKKDLSRFVEVRRAS